MATQDKGIGFDPETASAPRGKNHLLVIAIDEYAHCPRLHNCVKDAREFIEVLIGKYQFDPENITTLFNAEATRPNIHTQLKNLKGKVGLEDSLVIYFSGHGETEDKVGYWVPANARAGQEWEYFSSDEIKRRLDAINSFHTFVIVDACFSGALFSTFKSTPPGYESKRSRWGLAASHSRERALDGAPGENSPFAAILLRQMKGSQDDLPIQELAAAVIRQVERATEGRQTPVFKPLNVKGDDEGQYVFRLKANEETAWEDAVRENSLRAYNRYLGRFSRGKHADEALERIQALEDEQEWQKAERTGRVYAYQYYLRSFPAPRHAEAARQRIAELEAESVPPPGKQPQPQPQPEPEPQPQPEPEPQPNAFTDPRDGQAYRTVELNGRLWLAQNLNYDVGEGCWFYKNDPKNGEKYGRLYTWEAAKKACPPGWRLPTDEEWRNMTRQFGGADDDASDGGKAAYKALIDKGSSGFNALLGGWRSTDGSFYYLGDYGYYWSATEGSSGRAWYYAFHRDNGKLGRDDDNKGFGFSCRCVQD